MSEGTGRKGLVIVGRDVSDEQAEILEQSGFTVERVDSIDSVRNGADERRQGPSEDLRPCSVTGSASEVPLEEALRASENRYRMLYMSVNDGFYLSDIVYNDAGEPCDYRFAEVNPAFEQMMNLSRDQIIGKQALELFPDLSSDWMGVFRQVAESGSSVEHSFRSEVFGRHFEVYAFRPTAGQFAALVKDVTEAKRAQEALRISEERYRTLFGGMSEGFALHEIICDVDGKPADYRFLEINDAFERLTGLNREDVIGKTMLEVVPGNDPLWVETYGKVALTGESLRFENYSTPLGKWYEAYAFSPAHGQFAVMLTDITERKEAHEALGTTSRRFYAVLSSMYSAVLLVTEDDRVEFANQAFCQMYDLKDSPDELVGLTAQQMIGKIKGAYENSDDAIARIKQIVSLGQSVKGEEISLKGGLTCIRDYVPLYVEGESHGRFWQHVDITERKHAEDALRESEERFRTAFEDSAIATALTAMDGKFLRVNSAFCQMLGCSDAEMVLRNFADFTHPDDMAENLAGIQRLASGEASAFRMEKRYIRADGRVIRVDMSTSTVRNTEGRPLYLVTHVQDITERRQAEEALQESQHLLQDIMDSNPCAIFIKDLDGKFITINAPLEKMLGMTREQIVGKTDYDIATKEMADYWRAHDERVMATRQPMQVEEVADLQDGRHVFLANKSPLLNYKGQMIGVCAISHDITDRKRAEQELIEAHAHAERHAAELESFISSITDGVVLHDADGSVILTNEAARTILGGDPPGSAKERVEQYRICKMDGTPMKAEETASDRAARGETVKELRHKLVVPGGSEKVIAVSASPVRGADGTVLGATTVFRDITDQAEFERQKEELFEREHHIAEVLQRAIVPQDVPAEMRGYRFAVKYRPALREAEIGGDFYDVFELGDDKLGVLIGDVAGKGLAAAIRVASARHSIRSYAYLDPSPARVVTLANEALYRGNDDASHILTAFFAVLDPQAGTITYSSAGHEPPLFCGADGGCEELETGGRILGLMPGVTYKQSSRGLNPGDMLIAVTDGIAEARDPECTLYGKEKLIEFVKQHRKASPDEIAAGLFAAATAHSGGKLQDDAAVVVFSLK